MEGAAEGKIDEDDPETVISSSYDHSQYEDVFQLMLKVVQHEVHLRKSFDPQNEIATNGGESNSSGSKDSVDNSSNISICGLIDSLPVTSTYQSLHSILVKLQAALAKTSWNDLLRIESHLLKAMCRLIETSCVSTSSTNRVNRVVIGKQVIAAMDCLKEFFDVKERMHQQYNYTDHNRPQAAILLPLFASISLAMEWARRDDYVASAFTADNEHVALSSLHLLVQVLQWLLRSDHTLCKTIQLDASMQMLPQLVLAIIGFIPAKDKSLSNAAVLALMRLFKVFRDVTHFWRSSFPGIFSCLSKTCLTGSNRFAIFATTFPHLYTSFF